VGMDVETGAVSGWGREKEGEMVPRRWKVDRLDELQVLQRGFDLAYISVHIDLFRLYLQDYRAKIRIYN
jgi:hypothetical protein